MRGGRRRPSGAWQERRNRTWLTGRRWIKDSTESRTRVGGFKDLSADRYTTLFKPYTGYEAYVVTRHFLRYTKRILCSHVENTPQAYLCLTFSVLRSNAFRCALLRPEETRTNFCGPGFRQAVEKLVSNGPVAAAPTDIFSKRRKMYSN